MQITPVTPSDIYSVINLLKGIPSPEDVNETGIFRLPKWLSNNSIFLQITNNKVINRQVLHEIISCWVHTKPVFSSPLNSHLLRGL